MNKFIAVWVLLLAISCTNDINHLPQPTDTVIRADMEEEGKGEARREWIESLHRSAPEIDWRTVEYQTALRKHRQRVQKRSENGLRNDADVTVGNVSGSWTERGSANQAGNVVATEYDAEDDILYCISGGGSLFKGTIDGLNWEVLNQDFRFNSDFLKIIDHQGSKRMLAHINRTPHYSDDLGKTWNPSTGIRINDSWGNVWHTVVEGKSNRIILLSKPSYWNRLKMYSSEDGGETYTEVMELGSHDPALFLLYQIPLSNKIFFVEKQDLNSWRLSEFEEGVRDPVLIQEINQVGFEESRANLCGAFENDNPVLYIYNSEKEVWRSENRGASWTRQGKFSGSPWRVGMFASPFTPNVLLMGEVECYRSIDRGRRWQKINTWGEYYRDVANKLHADMMYFNAFTDANGEPFILISNHGGISISRNNGSTNLNIGLYGLNVSQYYSVRTDPINSDIIYAGSQDQGFQRGSIEPDYDWVEFDQVISGDYGHIIFTGQGSTLWTVYPGGSVSYYSDPHNDSWPTGGFGIDSDHESVWIPPMTPHPDQNRDVIYIAGGNIDGGEGSYVIEAELSNGSISLDQWDTNFRSISNDGKISAIAFSPLNHEHVFVAMDNGRFYYSKNGGDSFDKSVINVPGGHYLYGSSIVPSTIDPNVVYVSGSGYSTAPVLKSTDGGRIFRPLRDSLPNTMAFQIAVNEDESLIFAATESGPYIYLAEEDRWYDISGTVAPTQTYWSVEYLPEEKVARFGTYGRGIWDFEIEEISTSNRDVVHSNIKIFPNPAQNYVNIEGLKSASEYQIVRADGRQMTAFQVKNSSLKVQIESYPAGTYYLTESNGQNSISFIKL